MKITASITGWVLLAPLVVTCFVSLPNVHPKSASSLKATGDGALPDIVNAYKKTKPVANLNEISINTPVIDPTPPVVDVPVPEISLDTVVASASGPKFHSVNNFLKAAQDRSVAIAHAPVEPRNIPTLAEMMTAPVRSTVTETSQIAQNKVPTLAGFIKNSASGSHMLSDSNIPHESLSDMVDTKAKLGMMVSNTFDLFGASAPSGSVGAPNIPEGAAGWTVAALAIMVAIGQRNTGLSDARLDGMVQKEALAVSELAEHVSSMGHEIKKLNTQTAALRTELQAAQEKLTRKELEISKERLNVADKELKLNREIQKLQVQVKESDIQVKTMDKELRDTKAIRAQLSAALDKVKGVDSGATLEEIKIALEPTAAVNSVGAFFAGAKKRAAAKKATQGAKASTKKVAKGSAKTSEKSIEPKAKAAEEPKSKAKAVAEPIEPKAKAKAAEEISESKAKAKKSKSPKAKTAKVEKVSISVSNEWASLSPSTLERKTVKALREYLGTKGVETLGGDGKPLKKALLVEAVRSL